MTDEALKNLSTKFEILGKNYNQEFTQILVAKEDLLDVFTKLKTHPEFKCDNLHCISGVDYPNKGYIEINYHLFSYETPYKIVVKTRVERDNPEVDSLYPLWKTADWQERETAELFGINFKGHPNLKKLLLNEGFPGFPFRKDVPLENNEKWLLDDGNPASNYGIPNDLEKLYNPDTSGNGGKTS